MWFGGQPAASQQQTSPCKTTSGATNATTAAAAAAELLANSSSDLSQGEKISFNLKSGIFTKRVTVDSDKMALGLIKQLAIAFVNDIYFQFNYPTSSYIGDYIKKHYANADSIHQLHERLVLRKCVIRDDDQQETFVPFNSVSDIEADSYICIELSEKQSHLLINNSQQQQQLSISSNNNINSSSIRQTNNQTASKMIAPKRSHEFKPESFLFPTYCSNCTLLIKGVFKQGFQCQHCKRNFCPKCKAKAENCQESCQQPQQQQNESLATQSSHQSSVQSNTTDSGFGAEQNNSQSSSNVAAAKLDIAQPNTSNMSKRKSASNLLHFNIVFPFKSSEKHGANQQSSSTSETKSKTRGSAGALDPVLQQLGKMRDQQQQPQQQQQAIPEQQANNSLMVSQATHLSSSHQNLYLNEKEARDSSKMSHADESLAGAGNSSSAHQSPVTYFGINKQTNQQLSNSARTSVHDLYVNSPAKRDQANHTFVNMDWVQISGEPPCDVCKKILKSVQQQQPAPFICKTCKLRVHAQCQRLVLADCMSRIAESSRAAAQDNQAEDESKETTKEASDKTGLKNTNSNVSRDNIRLHRLTPSVKHIKRPDSTKPIIEGWLKHTTLSDEQARKHYWRLDETDITLYENDTSMRYFKAIALSKITRVLSAESLPKVVKEDVLISSVLITGAPIEGSNQGSKSASASPIKSPQLKAQMKAIFAFQLATGSMYLVQADNEFEASRWRQQLSEITAAHQQAAAAAAAEDPKLVAADEAKQPAKLEKNKATEEANKAPTEPKIQRQHHHRYPPVHHRGQQHKTLTDPNRSRLYNRPRITIKLDSFHIPDHLIEGKYLIERDRVKGVGFEELGSGQFGKVYAAISEWKVEDPEAGLWSGVPVAIKEISKARFDLRQQAKLKNEANILSRLDHPGVIILERVHDLPDKIYIVMEQLEDDMLEMIVSTEEKRLNERITKFLTYQILEALKYLHAQNIAHCDLKPENVLLVERRSQFPQIKLCDFGFAKIIEENSFRSSLVGTPAYLAPEVVKGERYNRSVDLWSVGVIVYVSLSGEFPFNEGENIHDQISRANFMYPDQPWAKISTQAKNFINSLLRVNCERRLSANRAQMDDWIQDYQLWCDLSELEVRVGKRWVTDDADFERWSKYAKEKHLQLPRSAIQLHEELLAD